MNDSCNTGSMVSVDINAIRNPEGTNCTRGEFECDNGNCVPLAFVRDGDNDCGDASDEKGGCLVHNKDCDRC